MREKPKSLSTISDVGDSENSSLAGASDSTTTRTEDRANFRFYHFLLSDLAEGMLEPDCMDWNPSRNSH